MTTERFGNSDLFCFSHPNYFIAHEDEVIGHLFKEYEKSFVVFEINNN